MLTLPLLSLLLATTALAVPHHKGRDGSQVPISAMNLPFDQTQLALPISAAKYVTMGVGVQNYSCTAGGNYTSIGAVAQLFDISQLYGTPLGSPEFETVQDGAYVIWSKSPDTDPLGHDLAVQLNKKFGVDLLGIHDFVNFKGKLSPKFDFTQTTHKPDDFVISAKIGDIPSPNGNSNVDWLELTNVDGGLGEVYRIGTKAGKPPSTCKPGSGEISVKYCAQYWVFDGSP